ncbi:MAG TPA: CHASE2 domain-containing protein [Chthoniobacterales bacterium]|nr:CHASE2 domain-containing protein [Chthoniobacterales bacterium]
MERPSIWVIIVVLLLCVLFLRDPRFQRSEEYFLRWLVRHSQPAAKSVPITIVQTGRENPPAPLETALLLRGALEFKPTVIAVEPVLQWGERNKDQQQIFIDQAMRVPRLLLGSELTASPDPDAPVAEIAGFIKVTGRRGDLPEFSGIEHQPEEDARIVSTLGFVNMPEEKGSDLHVPLLFQYRGEVIPSFALQAALLWMRLTPDEVKIDIGSAITLPNGTKIPIRSDGTLLINPRMAQRARHLTLNELLLAAEQHESGAASGIRLEDMRTHLVLARVETNAPDHFAAAIGAIQTNSFVRRVSWIFDCAMVVLAAALSGALRRFSRIDLIIGAIAFSAAYCLIALAIISSFSIWIPAWLPLGATWISVLFAIVLPKPKGSARTVSIAAPPPAP